LHLFNPNATLECVGACVGAGVLWGRGREKEIDRQTDRERERERLPRDMLDVPETQCQPLIIETQSTNLSRRNAVNQSPPFAYQRSPLFPKQCLAVTDNTGIVVNSTLGVGIIILDPVRQLGLTLPLHNLSGPDFRREFEQVLEAEELPWLLHTSTS
jgi:hypothetical protein